MAGILRTPQTLPNRALPTGKRGSRTTFFLYIDPRVIGQAFERDIALPITSSTSAGPLTVAVGQAAEFDTARAILPVKGAPPAPASQPQRVRLASYTLEIAWAAHAQGAFVLGSSTIGGTDTLGVSAFDITFGGPYDNMTSLFRGATVRRGRDNTRQFVVRGEATIIVKDRAGLLNPENAASPLQTLLSGRYQPGRLRGYLPDGTEFPLFYGFLEKIDWRPLRRHAGAGIATLQFKDLLLWLAEARPVIAATGPTTTGAAIGLVLDAIGWIEPAGRSLAVGDSIPDFSADGGRSGLELIGDLLNSERGIFYINGAGVAAFESRITRTVKAPVATITDEMKSAVPGIDHSRMRNRVRVKRTQTGYVATATDATSKTLIGDRDLEDIETPYLNGDSQADALASFILSQVTKPVSPMHDLKIDNRTDALLVQCLARELGDVVILTARGAQIVDPQYLIESLEHRISPQRGGHETTWLLSQHAGVTAFRLGDVNGILVGFPTSFYRGAGVLVY